MRKTKPGGKIVVGCENSHTAIFFFLKNKIKIYKKNNFFLYIYVRDNFF